MDSFFDIISTWRDDEFVSTSEAKSPKMAKLLLDYW